MKKVVLLILFYIGMVGCISDSDKTMVLNYDEFGPQVSSYETIGMNWWQWQHQANPDPAYHYAIKVVVYRDILLQQVMETYPIVQGKEQDYRYLSYVQALSYLNKEIQANILPELTTKLHKTKSKIISKLGK